MRETTVIWFTGLSGAGKTTLAEALKDDLERAHKHVVVLDGDLVREKWHRDLGFSAEDITENNRLIAELAAERLGSVDYVLVPVISPLRAARRAARERIGEGFVELYIKSSDAVRFARDPKGLYQRVRAGEITDFIGHGGVPYEEPEHPELTICTDEQPVAESVAEIRRFLEGRSAA